MRPRPLLLVLVALGLWAPVLRAQTMQPAERFARQDSTRHTIPAPLAGLLSAVVPGAGEYALGLDRWLPQLALEALGWWQYRAQRAQGRSFERKYRALACQVARRLPRQECRDTSYFEYYELMGKERWPSSGPFDADPTTPGIQPPVYDQSNPMYNGYIWSLAGAQFPTDTAARMAYYRRNAVPPAYYWNWTNNGLEQTVYDEYIRRGDDAFRTSSRILGFILVNHVTSAVDAFIVARLRELSHQPGIQVRSGLEPAGNSVRWQAGVTLPGPR